MDVAVALFICGFIATQMVLFVVMDPFKIRERRRWRKIWKDRS